MPFQTAKGFFNNGGFAMTIDTWHYTKSFPLSFLRVWSHLLKKSLLENFNFCAVGSKKLDYNLLKVQQQRNKNYNNLRGRPLGVFSGKDDVKIYSKFTAKYPYQIVFL